MCPVSFNCNAQIELTSDLGKRKKTQTYCYCIDLIDLPWTKYWFHKTLKVRLKLLILIHKLCGCDFLNQNAHKGVCRIIILEFRCSLKIYDIIIMVGWIHNGNIRYPPLVYDIINWWTVCALQLEVFNIEHSNNSWK